MAAPDTPLMRQYTEVKSRYSDALLFFRMGDFYEMFFDDAIVAAKALDLALTSRNKNDPNPVPMCGVPHHAAANYVNRLVTAGHKVAICEQLEDPAAAKGIVRRDVIRVVSPGTQLDPDSLEAKVPNFTHAVFPSAGNSTLRWATCDFTTGRFWFGSSQSAADWLAYAQSQGLAEVLFPDTPAGESMLAAWRESSPRIFAQTVPAFYFDEAYAADRIREQFGVATLGAVHPAFSAAPGVAGPAGALIKYFQETQKAPRIPSANRIEMWGAGGTMDLDPATVRSLELLPDRSREALSSRDVSLLSWLDRTKTAMGGRMLRDWCLRPLTSSELIAKRLDQVQALMNPDLDVQPVLAEIYDFERLLSRISLGSGSTATARELHALASSIARTQELEAALRAVPPLAQKLARARSPELMELARHMIESLADAPLPATTREGRMFRKGWLADLDALIELSENGEQWLAELETAERKKTGISSLKVRFNRVFGYYIEVTKANLGAVPTHYIRKQTMVGGERFITEELKSFEEKILTAEKKRCDMEYALFRDFCGQFAALAPSIVELSKAVAEIDSIAALARVAREDGYVRPVVDDSQELEIIDGRHPTVEVALARQTRNPAAFVPNTVRLDSKKPFLIITGPNMGGKSTVMRQTALITLMAQMGSFVPAKSARIGAVDRVFTRIGSADNLAEGASTFMVEMSEMSFILKHASAKSLILIDEVGRGTSTYDGMSLAWALAVEFATQVKARTLFATHYHELTRISEVCDTAANARVAVALTERKAPDGTISRGIRFLYRLESGVAERSYGILVARLAGLPEAVLHNAAEMLEDLESQARTPQTRKENPAQLTLELSGDLLKERSGEFREEIPVSADAGRAKEILTRLDQMNVDDLTPRQALTTLWKWKEELGSDPQR